MPVKKGLNRGLELPAFHTGCHTCRLSSIWASCISLARAWQQISTWPSATMTRPWQSHREHLLLFEQPCFPWTCTASNSPRLHVPQELTRKILLKWNPLLGLTLSRRCLLVPAHARADTSQIGTCVGSASRIYTSLWQCTAYLCKSERGSTCKGGTA